MAVGEAHGQQLPVRGELESAAMRVWGLGFGVWGLGFRVQGSGFRVWGLGFGV